MNKRQGKKAYYKSFTVCKSYTETRKNNRWSHEASIRLARKEKRNYWAEWHNGYPNRTRVRRIY